MPITLSTYTQAYRDGKDIPSVESIDFSSITLEEIEELLHCHHQKRTLLPNNTYDDRHRALNDPLLTLLNCDQFATQVNNLQPTFTQMLRLAKAGPIYFECVIPTSKIAPLVTDFKKLKQVHEASSRLMSSLLRCHPEKIGLITTFQEFLQIYQSDFRRGVSIFESCPNKIFNLIKDSTELFGPSQPLSTNSYIAERMYYQNPDRFLSLFIQKKSFVQLIGHSTFLAGHIFKIRPERVNALLSDEDLLDLEKGDKWVQEFREKIIQYRNSLKKPESTYEKPESTPSSQLTLLSGLAALGDFFSTIAFIIVKYARMAASAVKSMVVSGVHFFSKSQSEIQTLDPHVSAIIRS